MFVAVVYSFDVFILWGESKYFKCCSI